MGKYNELRREFSESINEIQESIREIKKTLRESKYDEFKNVITSLDNIPHVDDRNSQTKEFVYYMWDNMNSYYSGHIETIVKQSIIAIDYINNNALDLSEIKKGLNHYSSFSKMEDLREELEHRKQNK
jgi:hypothetical protein